MPARSTPLRHATLSLAALLIAADWSFAFESAEHKLFTESALCLAAKRVPSERVAKDVLTALRGVGPKSEYCDARQLTLGDVSVYADFVAAPRRLLQTQLHAAARLDTEELCKRSGGYVFGATEMIRNPHHFGREGILEYYAWHEHAILLATRAAALAPRAVVAAMDAFTDAVVFEGYAVHFLQDFFAPGHVDLVEPDLSISATLARHDRVNTEGEEFHLSSRWRPPTTEELTEAAHCLRLDESDVARAVDAYEREAGESRVKLQGDDHVYRSDVGRIYRPDEAIFITIATARSIEDLVRVYRDPAGEWRDQLTFPPFEGPMNEGGFGITELAKGICAWLPIGFYSTGPNGRASRDGAPAPEDSRSACPPTSGETATATPKPEPVPHEPTATPSGHVSVPAPSAGPTPSPSPSPTPSGPPTSVGRDPVGSSILTVLPRTAIDVTVDRLNEGSRKTIAGEIFLDWCTWSPVEYQTLEWSLGYTYIRGNSYDGQGFDTRAYYRFKNLYLWTSLGVGWRFLHDSKGSANAPTVGGRIGFGPEVLSVFTGVSVDSSLEDGKLHVDPLSFQFGVQAVIPWQRVGASMVKLFDGDDGTKSSSDDTDDRPSSAAR